MTSSLHDLANYVSDAYRLQPSKPFVPEDIVIGQYTFLPWVRSGVGAVVTPPATGLRATMSIAVPVQAAGLADLTAGTTVQVRGPGDVLGLDERQVIRRYPMPGAVAAEDSFLAHVELDRPVLPWLFSPVAPAGDRLTPWIALVVLAQGRYQLQSGDQGRPDHVDTFLGELQPTDDAWAWAHAQLIGPADTGPSIDDRLTPAYAAANLARLVCPRKLEQDTQYLACVVPLWNAGVATGLGLPAPPALDLAWHRVADGSDADTAISLPVYTSWRFGVGQHGDFGSLAAKLLGVQAPWQVGRRLTDTSEPGGGLPPLAVDDLGALQTIKGPLFSPNGPSAASADAKEAAAAIAETAVWPSSETEALRALINEPDQRAATTAARRPGPPPHRGSGDLRPVPGGSGKGRHQQGRRLVRPAERPTDQQGRCRARCPRGPDGPGSTHAVRVGAGRRDRRSQPHAAVGPARPVRRGGVLRQARSAAVVRRSHRRHPQGAQPGARGRREDCLCRPRTVQPRARSDHVGLPSRHATARRPEPAGGGGSRRPGQAHR